VRCVVHMVKLWDGLPRQCQIAVQAVSLCLRLEVGRRVP